MSLTTSDATKSAAPARPAPTRKRGPDRTHWLFLLPTLIVFTLCIALPAVMGIFFSFTNSVGYGDWDFVGLANYQLMFTDPAIMWSFGFTLGFSAVTVVVTNVIAFLLAVGLTSQIRGRVVLRTIFVIPMVVSPIIIAFVFQFLFARSLPAAAQAVGFGPLESSILADSDLAWISIVIVTAWQAIPGTMLIYIAGLVAIPHDVYEASSIDGAGPWKQLLTITVPLMTGYIVINVILTFKNFLNAYDIIVGLTDGGPGTSTRTVAMTIFSGFTDGDYAYQMATATIFFLITLAIALVQLRLMRRKEK
ncbi:carbohydrate ABC transporter permease [Nesterenkonia xinjiangensis]|uniref:Raffinose/stachyose/melibiose transport system permease protein n=1 Tax=Nesterenkonia xinjiangensis TaxID=225327 RepID=A0A7Z0GLD2_9MICC|nr:sugar ABC transporter permease [Nesterenkonia xinjiangensis]NYJ78137.1 raffinose/stachyose/melibiose transport system permease protein [Nesterenkonia xinjiangensis]